MLTVDKCIYTPGYGRGRATWLMEKLNIYRKILDKLDTPADNDQVNVHNKTLNVNNNRLNVHNNTLNLNNNRLNVHNNTLNVTLTD